jgi:hypothetical protein
MHLANSNPFFLRGLLLAFILKKPEYSGQNMVNLFNASFLFYRIT